MPGDHYQVFLSHASCDKPFVRQVAARLQREGISFFYDEANLVPGLPWQVALEKALGSSDSCAVFIGDEGMGPFHTLEMRAAISKQAKANRGFRLIPVLLPGKTRPSDRELPAFLEQLTWVEFTSDPDQDDTAYRRLKSGIEGKEPGFVPPTVNAAPVDLAALKIVPRGLRSFEPEDHAFFLKLVPGSRDQRGLPTVLRDWKRLVEQIDPDRTFKVAYWYGPSGCGKSSLVKAGLIPCLAEYVATVYVQAAVGETEGPVLHELRKLAATVPANLGLADSMAWVASHPVAMGGRKLFLVIDQFEQWLHAARGQLDGELATALRCCDGRHMQCLLLVRDEFKIPAHRLMKVLGIEQRENFNFALIDLFDAEFAREVLFEYGRGYGRLPDKLTELTNAQRTFLDRVIADLRGEDGKVVKVQLALLAQMLDGQRWTPAALDQIGGAAGIGRTFLEEKFDKRSASAECQLHREASIKLFEALLPELGTAIKGRSRSRQDLLEASGYAQRPDDFADLLQLLDAQLRIITPVETDDGPGYQLTHDYLVPSLRDWLTADQKSTWRGRGFLLLAERTAEWIPRQKVRSLPGPLEYMRIIAATYLPTRRLQRPAQRLKPPQRRLLWAATRWLGMMGAVLLLVVSLLGWWSWDVNGRTEAQRLVMDLNNRSAADHRSLVDNELAEYRRWVVPELKRTLEQQPGARLSELELVQMGQRRADAAIALVRLGAGDAASSAFDWKKTGDPEPLTQFVHRASERGVTADQLVELFDLGAELRDDSIRYAALLTLGTILGDTLNEARRQELAGQLKLSELYGNDPDSSTHSATGWLLRTWKLEIPKLDPHDPSDGGPN